MDSNVGLLKRVTGEGGWPFKKGHWRGGGRPRVCSYEKFAGGGVKRFFKFGEKHAWEASMRGVEATAITRWRKERGLLAAYIQKIV